MKTKITYYVTVTRVLLLSFILIGTECNILPTLIDIASTLEFFLQNVSDHACYSSPIYPTNARAKPKQ